MCFAFETRESLRVAGYFLGQELQCNEAMKPGVLGLVDDAHATAAEFLYDAMCEMVWPISESVAGTWGTS
jgi:hypothetical protein